MSGLAGAPASRPSAMLNYGLDRHDEIGRLLSTNA